MLLCWFFELLMFFFFKQKTAYEMRISDWSSDVCSSDLGGDLQDRHRVRTCLGHRHRPCRFCRRCTGSVCCGTSNSGRTCRRRGRGRRDRKSVVEGKSVSVRVDLGGRRIIKKKRVHTNNKTDDQKSNGQ